VQVIVTAEQGARVTDACVVFAVNGGAENDRELFGDKYISGWEREGNFVIAARKASYADAQKSVRVESIENGCHVAGKQLTLELTSIVN
jgi:hypothetical protein